MPAQPEFTPIPEATAVLPHQLFMRHPAISKGRPVLLIEDSLFFSDLHYPAKFHKQKLVLHRSSMQHYADRLRRDGFTVLYCAASEMHEGEKGYEQLFERLGIKTLYFADPCDYMVEKRIRNAAKQKGVSLVVHESPAFLTSKQWIEDNFSEKTHFTFSTFYMMQRKRLGILVDDRMNPIGGQWSLDAMNRKKIPKGVSIPQVAPLKLGSMGEEAIRYANKAFPSHPGVAEDFWFPTTHEQARVWLKSFVETRLPLFGDYQDAILQKEVVLMHSVLSPSLNTGLLTPQEVLNAVLERHEQEPISLNSLEGFIRQLIGWREFTRAVYLVAGVKQRHGNFWGHTRPLSRRFYDGTTGIYPVDITIQKLLKTGYSHHIERLMVLGNFMLLCEIHPDDVYRWFMEMYIDSYDWVMVPNVYGMSQYADGGLMTSKPYISGSHYLLKMSDYPKGEWCEIWDALFWRFLSKHQSRFKRVPRMGALLNHLQGMGAAKLKSHHATAEAFLKKL